MSKPLGSVVGIVLHDTVTLTSHSEAAVERWCTEGITQRIKGKNRWIPGPLYNEIIHRSGRLVVIDSDSKANHAGRINKGRFNALARGDIPPEGRPPASSSMTANSRLYGIAYVRGGDTWSDPMPAVTDAAFSMMVERCHKAAVRFGLSADQIWAHGELTRRKVDPAPVGTQAARVRAAVRDRMLAAAVPVLDSSAHGKLADKSSAAYPIEVMQTTLDLLRAIGDDT